MTPSVSQSSGCRLRRMFCSVRPIPSFPCSSSMSWSCELLLFTMIGPILRCNIPSLYIGCTFAVSLVRRITDLSWKVDDIRRRWKLGLCHTPAKSVLSQKHKQNRPKTTSLSQNLPRIGASKYPHENTLELCQDGHSIYFQSNSQPSITALVKSTSSYSNVWACRITQTTREIIKMQKSLCVPKQGKILKGHYLLHVQNMHSCIYAFAKTSLHSVLS